MSRVYRTGYQPDEQVIAQCIDCGEWVDGEESPVCTRCLESYEEAERTPVLNATMLGLFLLVSAFITYGLIVS